ncbi:unnamed protein product [Ceutorhynchus assimilis]|uniref:Uncharacterized protein n=1 Tax=Ceutorhynchus assimilis TaxID=467358 RepID=A0A9N9MU78_9CUCU|nr:unnamed protein product [Ceutorhynchus assimilis]
MAKIITLVALLCVTVATPARLTKDLNIRQEIENSILKSPGIVNIVELFNTKSNPEVPEVLEAFNRGIGFNLLTVKNGFVQANIDQSEVSLIKVPVTQFGKNIVQSRASIFGNIFQTGCNTVTSLHSQLNSALSTVLNNLKSIDIGAGNNAISQVIGTVLNVVLNALQKAIELINQLVESVFGSICTSSSRKRRDVEEADSALVNFRGDIGTRSILTGAINGVVSIVGGVLKVLVKILFNNAGFLIPIVLVILVGTLL